MYCTFTELSHCHQQECWLSRSFSPIFQSQLSWCQLSRVAVADTCTQPRSIATSVAQTLSPPLLRALRLHCPLCLCLCLLHRPPTFTSWPAKRMRKTAKQLFELELLKGSEHERRLLYFLLPACLQHLRIRRSHGKRSNPPPPPQPLLLSYLLPPWGGGGVTSLFLSPSPARTL
jgi:hypothetical protein